MTTRAALALGSGGARGYAHIGAIREIRSRGVEIAGIAGSSMGALVGGMQAAGKLDEYADWVVGVSQFELVRLLDVSFVEPGAIRAERILDRLRDILGDVQIEDLPIPFTAVATDLTTGRSVWFQRGALDTAIRASIAIPGVISPSLVGNRVLADGGILDPLPVVATAGIQADLTIGIDVSGDVPVDDWVPTRSNGSSEDWMTKFRRGVEQLRAPMESVLTRFTASDNDEPKPEVSDAESSEADSAKVTAPSGQPTVKIGRVDVMDRSLDVMQAALSRYHRAGHPPDILIEVPRNAARTMDFHRAEELIEVGRSAAAKALDAADIGARTAQHPPDQPSDRSSE